MHTVCQAGIPPLRFFQAGSHPKCTSLVFKTPGVPRLKLVAAWLVEALLVATPFESEVETALVPGPVVVMAALLISESLLGSLLPFF